MTITLVSSVKNVFSIKMLYLHAYFLMTRELEKSEWTGFRGKVGGWLLSLSKRIERR
jgi:hypothetical protein